MPRTGLGGDQVRDGSLTGADLADNSIGLSKIARGTPGRMLGFNLDGQLVELAASSKSTAAPFYCVSTEAETEGVVTLNMPSPPLAVTALVSLDPSVDRLTWAGDEPRPEGAPEGWTPRTITATYDPQTGVLSVSVFGPTIVVAVVSYDYSIHNTSVTAEAAGPVTLLVPNTPVAVTVHGVPLEPSADRLTWTGEERVPEGETPRTITATYDPETRTLSTILFDADSVYAIYYAPTPV